MNFERRLKKIIAGSIDIHVHIGPEVIPRKYTAASLQAAEQGKLAGVVLKNHFYVTGSQAAMAADNDFHLIGAVVLNLPAGGLNAEAVLAASYIASGAFVVWLPTIHAQQFLDNSDFELAPEWCSGQDIQPRKASEVMGISLLDAKGCLTAKSKATLDAVIQTGAVLATGHISTKETIAAVDYLRSRGGVQPVVVTHPIYQRIAMPIADQQALTKKDCYMEVCYSMHSLDNISLDDLVSQIRLVGPARTILSSDMGQLDSPAPSDALLKFTLLLTARGIPVEWIQVMLQKNPRLILNLE